MFGFDDHIIWDCFEQNDKEALDRKIRLIVSDDDQQLLTGAAITKDDGKELSEAELAKRKKEKEDKERLRKKTVSKFCQF